MSRTINFSSPTCNEEDEEYNGEDYGIDSLYHAQRILEKTLGKVDGYQTDDGILEHKAAITAVKKLYGQKPWSEEDEKIIKRIDSLLYFQCKIHGSEYEEIHNWLKSLRPQNTWKPSKEQMEVLLSEVTGWKKGCPKQIVLESLYNDLKKLK